MLELLDKQITADDIFKVNEMIAEVSNLSTHEKQLFDEEILEQVIYNCEEYLNGIKADVENLKATTGIVNFNVKEIIAISLVMGAPIVAGIIVARRKKNEE